MNQESCARLKPGCGRRGFVGVFYSAASAIVRSVSATLAASSALAASYSAARRAISSAAGGIDFTEPIPWPQPQMSRQALAFELPPEPKFIAEASDVGRLAGSSPAAMIDGVR